MKKLIIVLFTLALIVGCKKEVKKESLSFSITGMTAENGCATNIQKKLSETNGILKAEVKLNKNIGIVEFDSNVLNKEAIYSVVSDLANEKGVKCCKASDITTKSCCNGTDKKACTDQAKENCAGACGNPNCAKKEVKKACCATKDVAKTKTDGCSKPCCAPKKIKKSCAEGCVKPCCASKSVKKPCGKECKKPCCS